jgi:hypothetical protein
MWSYHWQSKYTVVLMPLQEWTYNNPWYTLEYYRNYYFRNWNTCSKWGLPPFPSPHLTTNGYLYCQKQLSNLDGHCHCWLDLHKYGAMNIDNDNICNDDGCSGTTHSYIEQTRSDDFIPLVIETYGCLHSHFDSFFTTYAQTTIARHQQSFLIPLMFVSYYGQRVSITL